MDRTSHQFLEIIRNLERENGILQQKVIDLTNRQAERREVIDVTPREVPQVEALAPAAKPSIERVENAEYIEGVAYASRNFRRNNKDRPFRHFPIVAVAVFESDAQARAFNRERKNSGYQTRLGSCIIEKPAPKK